MNTNQSYFQLLVNEVFSQVFDVFTLIEIRPLTCVVFWKEREVIAATKEQKERVIKRIRTEGLETNDRVKKHTEATEQSVCEE